MPKSFLYQLSLFFSLLSFTFLTTLGVQAQNTNRTPGFSLNQNSLTVDWQNVLYSNDQNTFSLNANMGLYPEVTENANYRKGMQTMKPGLLRLHPITLGADSDYRNWSIGRNWSLERITPSLDGLQKLATENYKPELVLVLGGWPKPFKTYQVTDPKTNEVVTDELLDPSEYNDYVRFATDLVKIVNIDQKRQIKYFEIFNERDNDYTHRINQYNQRNYPDGKDAIPSKVEEFANLYNRVAKAMKAVDPSIKIGGPALQHVYDLTNIEKFIQITSAEVNPRTLDYFSAHSYFSSKATDSEEQIYQGLTWVNQHQKMIRSLLDRHNPEYHVPLWWNEYNLAHNYSFTDNRMQTQEGAIFDAVMATKSLDNGVDILMPWNDADPEFGKLDHGNDYRLFPGAKIQYLLSNHQQGERVSTNLNAKEGIYAQAVKNNSGYSLLLINRSDETQSLTVDDLNMGSTSRKIEKYTLERGNLRKLNLSKWFFYSKNQKLAPKSVTILVYKI